MRWYRIAKIIQNEEKTAQERMSLRRNDLHVDMRVYVGEPTDFSNANDLTSKIKSIVVAAINKSLDVIGIVAQAGPEIGIQAQQIANQSQYDLWVCPGQEYQCIDKFSIVAYNTKAPLKQGMTYEQAAKETHRQGGSVMVMNLSKRAAQQLNKYKGTELAPDFVEIANDKSGGFKDFDVDYPKFENSASTNANEMEASYTFTIISRKDFAKMNLMPLDEGKEYTPEYLEQDDIENPNPQVNPNPEAKAQHAMDDPALVQDSIPA